MDRHNQKQLDDLLGRVRPLEIQVAEMTRELTHTRQLLDEYRKNVKTIVLRINATFITGLLSIIAALVSALYYKS